MSAYRTQPDQTKARLSQLLIEAGKLERDIAQHHFDWDNWRTDGRPDGPPDWLIEKDEELGKPFQYLARSLYLTTVVLESSELHAYLQQFYKQFGESFDAHKAASTYDIEHYWSGEPYNVFLSDLRQFLEPLDVLGDDDRYLKLSGVQYLETILRNTATIIHKSGECPTSEVDVYKAVRTVLEVVFPSITLAKGNFFNIAQTYKPDVLIPELSAAVEYKYADSEAKLKATIAQISDDVNGYTGDSDYNLFYAVFYVKNDFWGNEKFNAVWDEKKFPKTWRGIYVVGK